MSTPSRRRSAALVLVFALAVAACGKSDALEGTVVKDGVGCAPEQVDRPATLPDITPVTDVGDKVDTEELTVGKGCSIDSDTYATLDLVGATADDATVFTDTIYDGRPLTVVWAGSTLLTSLHDALDGMKVGGQRKVVIPAELAYGKDGYSAQKIGPDEALVFEVELVAVSSAPLYCSVATIDPDLSSEQPTEVNMPVEVPKELKVTTLEEGTGAAVTDTDYVTADYLGVGCNTGAVFDSSWQNGSPITFTMPKAAQTATAGPVIEGWMQGLKGIKVGSLVQLDIPSKLAYGTQGSGSIAPNEALTFVVRVIAAAATDPAAATSTTVAATTTTGG